jgi:hypothetical protein
VLIRFAACQIIKLGVVVIFIISGLAMWSWDRLAAEQQWEGACVAGTCSGGVIVFQVSA